MTRRLHNRAALLVLMLAGATQSLCAAPPDTFPTGISGQQAVDIITAAMVAAGVGAPAPAAPARSLPACDHVPRVAPLNGNWGTAQLTCDSPVAWQRTLRNVSAKGFAVPASDAVQPVPGEPGRLVVALRHTLERGSQIAPDDLELKPAVNGGPEATFADIAAVSGRRLRVSISAGTVVIPRYLEEIWMVAKGGPVSIHLAGAGLSIAVPGEALENGGYGDLVRARNLQSGIVIRGFVSSENNVEVRPNMR